MGQKVNPHGLRVGVIKEWDSRWYAKKADFGDMLVEDICVPGTTAAPNGTSAGSSAWIMHPIGSGPDCCLKSC